VEGFKPSTFTAIRHQSSSYPLEHRHVAVPCAGCHKPHGAEAIYVISDTRCAACHSDVHRGQFETSSSQARCEDCHTPRGFRPSTFTLARHATAKFPLTGGHGAVVCSACHGNGSSARFRLADQTCAGCHRDPHDGQFATLMSSVRADSVSGGCLACHNTTAWSELSAFDHATTAFRLQGTHRAVPCAQCHRPTQTETGTIRVHYRAVGRRCAGCHEDYHGGQFAKPRAQEDCGSCHGTLKWTPATFDHGTHSTYPLRDAHRNLSCAMCHTKKQAADGKTFFVYRGTPRECSACHSRQIASRR
jgi:hypothetical protein